MTASVKLPGSFRDPSGFLFRRQDGVLYRQVNRIYEPAYRQAVDSGLYRELSDAGLLVTHETAPLDLRCSDEACAVLRPCVVPFVSYPYEWSFTQLKDAALLTLDIQKRVLERGMSLKDASAYNVQFDGVAPIFVDTLSFEPYQEGLPWIAYGQFCRHFLAPLALMAMRDGALGTMLQVHLDGIPLETASRLLPASSWLRGGLLTHVHLHARAVRRHLGEGRQAGKPSVKRMSRTAMRALIDHLESTVRGLEIAANETPWLDYEDTHTYSADAVERKQRIVADYLARIKPRSVWDLGANTGRYSRIAAEHAELVVAMDGDWACVEAHVRACKRENVARVLPLRVDLANPSPGLGWAHTERSSLLDRGPADAALALALIHHLAIGNNVPLDRVASFLRQVATSLVVEFVPKDDPQTQRLLAARADIFPDYTQEGFEAAFAESFAIVDAQPLPGSGRRLYLMKAD